MNFYRIFIKSRYTPQFFIWITLLAVLTACTWVTESWSSPPAVASPVPTTALTSSPAPTSAYPWRDASDVVRGICFEAAFDAAGRIFVLRSAADYIQFLDLADNSRLCRHPVARAPLDFSTGSILVGLWSQGIGCTARHDVLDYRQDDRAKIFMLRLKFITEGDCPYELVRPFWIALDGLQDYAIQVNTE